MTEMLASVEWGEFAIKDIFTHIRQGRRLRKEDQQAGHIPFVMAGVTNTGVVGYISNPVALFPKNSITLDIFGNAFYRAYAFGAGDDTGVYWNEKTEYSHGTMLFLAVAMQKAVEGKFSYGKKLRSSQSYEIKINLPHRNGRLALDFMEKFVAELEAYLLAAGLKDYVLTAAEEAALADLLNGKIRFGLFAVTGLFKVENTFNILSRDIKPNSGITPYLCASRENNAVHSYINYDEDMKERGDCIFIGGKTFVVTYQPYDFFSNDSHNLCLYFQGENGLTKLQHFCMISCLEKSLGHKYSWGDSISNKKIQSDNFMLPEKDGSPDYAYMQTLLSAVQKQVIKDVVQYADRKIAATQKVIDRE